MLRPGIDNLYVIMNYTNNRKKNKEVSCLKKADIEKCVYDIADPICSNLKCDLIDVEYAKENNEWYLRIYIQKDGGITIDDCTGVSRAVSEKLDEIDPIDSNYILEVSSPGINRLLKNDREIEKFAGSNVAIKLFAPLNGIKKYEGILLGLKDGKIAIKNDEKEISFDKASVSSVKLSDS